MTVLSGDSRTAPRVGVLLCAVLAALAVAVPAVATAEQFRRGDVLVSKVDPNYEGKTEIQVYSPEGAPLWTFAKGAGAGALCFSTDGQYLVAPGAGLFDRSGNEIPSLWKGNGASECAVDNHGNVYIGAGGAWGPPATAHLLKYDINGDFLREYKVQAHYTYGPVVNALDIGPDGCTIYYGGGGDATIERFDVCTETQLTPWSTGGLNDALRVRPNGQIVVGEDFGVGLFEHVGEEGRLQGDHWWAPLGGAGYFSWLSLAPDGTTVWIGTQTAYPWGFNHACTNVYHYDMEGGNPRPSQQSFELLGYLHEPTCGTNLIDGLAVYGSSSEPPVEGLADVAVAKTTAVGQNSAVVHGTVNPQGQEVTRCEFFVAGRGVPCSPSPVSGTTPVAVSANVPWLYPNTGYRVVLDAETAAGDSLSSDVGSYDRFETDRAGVPEFGRCVPSPSVTGKFATSSCTTKSPGEESGAYEWTTWPFFGKAGLHLSSTAAARLRTATGTTVACHGTELTGEYKGSRTISAGLSLRQCRTARSHPMQCHSAGGSDILESEPLVGTLGLIQGGRRPTVGLDLAPATGSRFMTFKCGSEGLSLSGAVIAHLVGVDTMASQFNLVFKASSGKQAPESFEGGTTDTLTLAGGGSEASARLVTAGVLLSEEPIEIKATD